MINEMCFHCDQVTLSIEDIFLQNHAQHVSLCNDCYHLLKIDDLVKINKIGGLGSITVGGNGKFWVKKVNVDYIKSIPKKFIKLKLSLPSLPPEFDSKIIAEVAKQLNSVCPRKYHGLTNCTCGKCPKLSQASANRNVFGYIK